MLPHPSRSALAAAAAVASLATSAAAQQRPDSAAAADSARAARRLAPVVVTATRTPTRADELPQRVATITREQLARTPANDAVDALKKLAGVDVVQYPSLLGGVGIRGFRPSTGGVQQRVLVLLDGRPAGAYNLALLDLTNVERIEVLRGPASAQYGSSAVGGVVNIVTHTSRDRLGGAVTAGYGSFATSELALRAGGRVTQLAGRPVDVDVTARRYDQGQNYRLGGGTTLRGLVGGDDARKVYTGTTRPSRAVPDTVANGLVRDFTTFTTASGSARVGVALPGALRVDVRGEGLRARDVLSPGDVYARLSQFPGDARKNVLRRSEDVALSRDPQAPVPTAGLTHAPLVRAYDAREQGDNYDQPGDAGFINYRSAIATSGVQLQDALGLAGQVLTVGVDGSRVASTSNRYAQTSGVTQEIGTYSPNSRLSSLAGFAEAHLRSPGGRVTATAGARIDRIALAVLATPFRPDVTAGTRRFNAFNPSAGVQVALGGGVRAHGTMGRAFLAPDAFGTAGFAQAIAGTTAALTVGNPDLRPEQSTTTDLGLSFGGGRSALDVDVTGFRTDVRDRITTARATFAAGQRPTTAAGMQVSGITTSVNAGQARIRGVELHVGFDLGRALGQRFGLSLFADGTRLLRAEEVTAAVRVDTAGFGAIRALDAAQLFGAIRLGPNQTAVRIRNVASVTTTYGVEYDDHRRFTTRLAGRYVGRRLDSDFSDATDPSDIEYAPFMVLDLSAGVRVGARYHLDALVANLTDENYYEKRGYNLPGRTVRLRATAAF